MSNRLDPGPPLTAGDEFFACAAPTTAEYVKASLVAFLLAAFGAGTSLLVTIATHRVIGVVLVAVGVVIGLAVHRAAGRHRSSAMGAIAAGATMLAASMGYGLLWLPFVSPELSRSLSLVNLATIGLGLFIAFLLAGPRPTATKKH